MIITKIPQPGDISIDVGVLQAALNIKGLIVKVDGDFGPVTRKAVSEFQKRIGLPGSGVPGPVTIESLGITLVGSFPAGPVTTGVDPDEGTPPWYRRMFSACEVVAGKEDQLRKTLATIDRGLIRYMEVSGRLGFRDNYVMIFAYILGALHFKEASCNFSGVLHNGERIIGTNEKTTLVPRGRGPFSSWEDSAVDAINLNGARWQKLREGSTDIGDILYAVERFNGPGYINGAGKLEVSPYLWECSNVSDGVGKYVSDGKFDPSARLGSTVGVALILKELWRQGAFKCTGIAPSGSKPIPLPDTRPYPVSTITRDVIAEKIVSIIQRDVDAELRETAGHNRSPRIDSFNLRTGVPLGSPYCASGAWCAIDDACKILGLKNPVPKTASSQAFRRREFVPQRYIRPDGEFGRMGDAAVFQNVGDSSRGHYATLKKDQVQYPYFDTVEYNTNGSGWRDGDGAYEQRRSHIDRSSENAGKIFVCFTDIPQWIFDSNIQSS